MVRRKLLKTGNPHVLARVIRGMAVGSEHYVGSAADRAYALRCWKTLRETGVVNFTLKTWANDDGTFTMRAVEP